MPQVAPLHHIPTLTLMLAAPFLLQRWPVQTSSVACVVAFFALHTVEGRYTYTNTPYDSWTAVLFGLSVGDLFGLERNHYDRFVHFCYGLLIAHPTFDLLRRHLRLSRRVSLYITLESVIAVSAVYELFEWFLSIVLAGPMAADYNGPQGDIWDAQKDMALATAGALTSLLWLLMRRSGHGR
jgi:putative membrane protein